MIELVSRMVFPFTLAVAAGILVTGYSEVGDGFSAGTIAGLGAVAQYVCLDREQASRIVLAPWSWWFLASGLLLALCVMLGPVFFGIPPVSHYPAPGETVHKFGVLELHTALLFDIGVMMLVYGAFVGTFYQLFPTLRGDE